MPAFQLRVMATARIAGYVTIDAETEELAIEEAKKLDVDSVVFQVDDDFVVEGDPVGFIRPEYDGTPETESVGEIEIDLRPEGEPFSWEAVQIVKDLAALPTSASGANVAALIERAKVSLVRMKDD